MLNTTLNPKNKSESSESLEDAYIAFHTAISGFPENVRRLISENLKNSIITMKKNGALNNEELRTDEKNNVDAFTSACDALSTSNISAEKKMAYSIPLLSKVLWPTEVKVTAGIALLEAGFNFEKDSELFQKVFMSPSPVQVARTLIDISKIEGISPEQKERLYPQLFCYTHRNIPTRVFEYISNLEITAEAKEILTSLTICSSSSDYTEPSDEVLAIANIIPASHRMKFYNLIIPDNDNEYNCRSYFIAFSGLGISDEDKKNLYVKFIDNFCYYRHFMYATSSILRLTISDADKYRYCLRVIALGYAASNLTQKLSGLMNSSNDQDVISKNCEALIAAAENDKKPNPWRSLPGYGNSIGNPGAHTAAGSSSTAGSSVGSIPRHN